MEFEFTSTDAQRVMSRWVVSRNVDISPGDYPLLDELGLEHIGRNGLERVYNLPVSIEINSLDELIKLLSLGESPLILSKTRSGKLVLELYNNYRE